MKRKQDTVIQRAHSGGFCGKVHKVLVLDPDKVPVFSVQSKQYITFGVLCALFHNFKLFLSRDGGVCVFLSYLGAEGGPQV